MTDAGQQRHSGDSLVGRPEAPHLPSQGSGEGHPAFQNGVQVGPAVRLLLPVPSFSSRPGLCPQPRAESLLGLWHSVGLLCHQLSQSL